MKQLNNIEKGNLLFSDISILGDAYFSRSVILITEHNELESTGFIINKSSQKTINDYFPSLNCFFTVFEGGPVGLDKIYYLHTIPELISNSIEIADGIYWGGNFEDLLNLIKKNLIDKQQIRFFNGYSGWDKDQLNNELNQNTWIISKNYFKKEIFTTPSELIWKNYIKNLGIEYSLFYNSPDNPNFN